MIITEKNFYSFFSVLIVIGYIWLGFNFFNEIHNNSSGFSVCIVKNTTNIPCPSCGTSRSVLNIFKGNLVNSFNLNPLGFVVVFILLISPLWILFDKVNKNKSLFLFYRRIEIILKKKLVAFLICFLLLINWIHLILIGA